MRTCIECKKSKSPTEFYVRNKVKGHLSSSCKECTKERVRKRHESNPSRTKNNALKRQYGITLDEHNKMFDEQNGVCYLCKKPGDGRWKKLCVDHDHTTGKVRKLLCRSCNTALGQVGDNVELLTNMIQYLKEH